MPDEAEHELEGDVEGIKKASMNKSQMKKELILRNFNWRKAEEKISKFAATE